MAASNPDAALRQAAALANAHYDRKEAAAATKALVAAAAHLTSAKTLEALWSYSAAAMRWEAPGSRVHGLGMKALRRAREASATAPRDRWWLEVRERLGSALLDLLQETEGAPAKRMARELRDLATELAAAAQPRAKASRGWGVAQAYLIEADRHLDASAAIAAARERFEEERAGPRDDPFQREAVARMRSDLVELLLDRAKKGDRAAALEAVALLEEGQRDDPEIHAIGCGVDLEKAHALLAGEPRPPRRSKPG